MTNGSHSSSPSSPSRAAAGLTGWRARVVLAASETQQDRGSIDVHAVLNLLNRFNATDEKSIREELVGSLADYLAAVHRVETQGALNLASLCELTRNYAAMRYLMADAIEPGIDQGEGNFSLRTEQSGDMTAFLQQGIDSLLDYYTPRISLSWQRSAWWQVELTMRAQKAPGQPWPTSEQWTPTADGSAYLRSARFTAISRPPRPSRP
jgi:hypothetical protein